MNVESLKKEARRHEQREEWNKALDLYLEAVDKLEDQENPDIALLNRAGDLQVRVGDVDGAVVSYQRAIELYLEAELPNNAIAICRKIIRHAPRRSDPYLTMGQIRAEQGFVVDARQNYLTYAEKALAGGDGDEALRALTEFVQRVPDDVETRLFLAEQLAGKEETADAVTHFRKAYEQLAGKGAEEDAEAVAARLEELAPGQPLPATGAEPEPAAAGAEDDLMVFESTSMAPETVESAQEEATAEEEELDFSFSEIGLGDGDDEADGEAEVEPEAQMEADTLGFDASVGFDDDSLSFDDDPLGLDDDSLAGDDDAPVAAAEEDEDFGFGDISLGGEFDLAVPEEGELEETEELDAVGELEEIDEDEDIGGELPTFGMEEAEDEDELEFEDDDSPLPMMELGDVALDEETETAAEETAEDELEPERDGHDWRSHGEELLASGDREAGIEALETAHALLAREGNLPAAMDVVRTLIGEQPNETVLYQRLVEYGYQSGDKSLLVDAFLSMARSLEERDETEMATAVYRKVLNLDSGNAEASGALGEEVAAPAEEEAAADRPAEEEEYVDLGSLVFDDDQEKTTRWVISAQAPSGDEQADFARMLAQFKEKVAENLGVDDAKAHYDLGTAYKEMGLLDEAISEFQQSLRAEPASLATYEMLGQCFLEKGEPEVAIRALERAREFSFQVEDDLLGIYYFLGRSYEETGEEERAREVYEKVFSLDINFKDVTERLRALR